MSKTTLFYGHFKSHYNSLKKKKNPIIHLIILSVLPVFIYSFLSFSISLSTVWSFCPTPLQPTPQFRLPSTNSPWGEQRGATWLKCQPIAIVHHHLPHLSPTVQEDMMTKYQACILDCGGEGGGANGGIKEVIVDGDDGDLRAYV